MGGSVRVGAVVTLAVLALTACGGSLPPAPGRADINTAGGGTAGGTGAASADYRIGPLDTVQVFVWQAPEFSVTVPVRPDGKISTPLVADLQAAEKTPSELAGDIRERLSPFLRNPLVTVMVSDFVGPLDRQVRVVGEAQEPRAIPYRANLSALDVLIEVGGLTEFAAGNHAVLVRRGDRGPQSYNLRLDDLLKEGDIAANVPILPGDVIIIPQSWF